MEKHYWQLYANYQAFGRLFRTIILWQLCKLHSCASSVELFIILYWYIYIASYWNILLWILGGCLCLFLWLHFSSFCTYPSESELPKESPGQLFISIGSIHSSVHPEGHQTYRQKWGVILLSQDFPGDLCILSLFKTLLLLYLGSCIHLHAPNSVAWVSP